MRKKNRMNDLFVKNFENERNSPNSKYRQTQFLLRSAENSIYTDDRTAVGENFQFSDRNQLARTRPISRGGLFTTDFHLRSSKLRP